MFELSESNDNFSDKTVIDYSANWRDTSANGQLPKSNPTNKLLHKEEINIDLEYKREDVEFKTENKIKGKIFTDKLTIDKNKYKKNDAKNKNKDFTVFSAYTSNKVKKEMYLLRMNLVEV